MEKKKDILTYALLTALVVLQVVFVNLNFWIWLKIVLSVIIYVVIVCVLIIVTKKNVNKNKKATSTTGEALALKPTDPTLLDMYAILKIAPQYNADGSLKDMYQLLGISPKYKADGSREITIYELLGINPMFTQDGKEIPFVLRIKNRVNTLVKLQAAPLPLTYFPRDKQIIGQKPILPEPILTEKTQQQQPPQFNKIPVVKPPAKKAASKPAPVNYGASAHKVSVNSVHKLSYKTTKVVNESTVDRRNLFNITDRKSTPVVVSAESTKKVEKPVEKNNQTATVLINLPSENREKPKSKPDRFVVIESSNNIRKLTEKDASFVEFTSINTASNDNSGQTIERV